MNNTTTVRSISSIDPKQLHDDVMESLTSAGFSEKEIERYFKQQQYRALYNQREEVKKRRAIYNKQRNERMKQLRQTLGSL